MTKIKIDSFIYHEIKRLAGLKNPDWNEFFEMVRPDDKRTSEQNSAIHLYLTHISEALNEAGLSIQEVLKSFKMDIEWTPENAKEILWRTAQIRMFNKKSTTELEKTSGEIDKIHDVINRFLATLGIKYIPFPNKELLIKKEE